jgi:2,4-dienoyl-CoA reductase-like NADH-dependent reductase (Old Yellow Enzyme family)
VTSRVFSPAALKGLRLENRVVLSPMTRMQAAEDGTPTEAMARYYASYAALGVGLLMTEATYTDEHASRAYFNQPGMANPRHQEGWRRVVDAVHAAGRPIFLQLQHGGRLAEPGLHACALGASGIAAAGLSWQTARPYAAAPVRAAAREEIGRIVRAFAEAARRARQAGFDGVEIHGARGYLLDEFLSRPGMEIEERLAVPLSVVHAVRDAFPDGPLSYNLSLYKMDDSGYQPPGGGQEVALIAASLCDAGVDALHVTTRKVLRPEPFGNTLAEAVRAAVSDRVLIANGGVRTLEDAESALAQTGADFVAMARALLANPDWIGRVRAGGVLQAYKPGMEKEPLWQGEIRP